MDARANTNRGHAPHNRKEHRTMSKKNSTKTPKAKPAKAKPAAETVVATAQADGKMSGLDAAAKVLADAGTPLGAGEMIERMISQGLWKTEGKTPAATIYTAWTMLPNMAA